ncbi:hypothetical protein ABID16_000038 [Rhizobium aquaticum]|uniref:Uncharacterized protein n=1 Tax=Rhizobium aquaticum TaxID=1549636 RepID=A0ABV2ITR2_9HYPH
MTYKLDRMGWIIRIDDGAVIPADPGNRDYGLYLEWVAAGNKTAPYAEAITSEMIRAEGARRLALIGSPYSQEERETWSQQVTEAKAIIADASADAPLLSILAAADQVPVAQMASTVLAKADAFAAAAGAVLAAQRTLLSMDPLPADYAGNSRWVRS